MPPTPDTAVRPVLRTTALAAAVAPALLGALTSPPRLVLVGAPLVGAVAVAVPKLAAWGLGRRAPTRRTLAAAATTGMLAVPLVPGVALLAPGVPVLPAALLALAAAALGISRAGRPSPRGAGAGARPPSAGGARSAWARRR